MMAKLVRNVGLPLVLNERYNGSCDSPVCLAICVITFGTGDDTQCMGNVDCVVRCEGSSYKVSHGLISLYGSTVANRVNVLVMAACIIGCRTLAAIALK
jgi:hypothetical protein